MSAEEKGPGASGFARRRRYGFARIGEINEPAQGERELTIARHFHRHLISRTAHAAGLNLEARLGIVNRALQNFQRVARGILFRDLVESAVNNSLRGAFLSTNHHRVDQA